MNTQAIAENPEGADVEKAELLPLPQQKVSEKDFEDVVRGAIEAVGGTLLFKVQVGSDDDSQHVAAAAVGEGKGRQFLLLTLPAGGGHLKVETAAKSSSPLAHIAASYAGLMDFFKAAA